MVIISSDINLVKTLSSLNNYDALIVVATQLEEIKGFVHDSVMKDLDSFSQVRI